MSCRSRKKLFAVCFVKNEEDIIADCLKHAARFCDRIYVVDNASTDRTWEIVRHLDLGPVLPVCSRDFVYRDYLRVWFMGAKKNELGLNNWWYILDADVFLEGNPLDAIALAEAEGADAIAVNVVNFHITREEIEETRRSGRVQSWRDRKYYELYESGEVDLFKNTAYLNYGICARVPFGLTRECSRRLPLNHYPYRSRQQIEKRIRARYQNREFASEYKRGAELDRYLVNPSLPQIKRLEAGQAIDFNGKFTRIVPRINPRGRDRISGALARILRPFGLMPLFISCYNRYAAWRQNVDPAERPAIFSDVKNIKLV